MAETSHQQTGSDVVSIRRKGFAADVAFKIHLQDPLYVGLLLVSWMIACLGNTSLTKAVRRLS
jgi:hypothetical protein